MENVTLAVPCNCRHTVMSFPLSFSLVALGLGWLPSIEMAIETVLKSKMKEERKKNDMEIVTSFAFLVVNVVVVLWALSSSEHIGKQIFIQSK